MKHQKEADPFLDPFQIHFTSMIDSRSRDGNTEHHSWEPTIGCNSMVVIGNEFPPVFNTL